jgi:hypothetical protein
MITLALKLTIILAFVFVSRIVAAAQLPSGADTSFKVHCVDEIRANRHRIPGALSQVITSRFWGMPPVLLVWVLSFFPRKRVIRSTAFFGALFDSIHTVLVMGIAAWYFKTQTAVPAGPGSLLAGFLFAVTPFLVRSNGPSRLKLSERAIGAVLLTFSMVPVLFWHETNALWPLPVSILAVALVFLLSNFGAQAVWFLYVVVCLVTLDPLVISIPILGVVTATLLSGGWYLNGLRAHLWHLRYWTFAQFREGCSPPINRLALGLYHGRLDISFNLDDMWLPRFVHKHVYSNPIVNLYHQIPLLILSFPLLVSTGARSEAPILFAWVAFGLGMNAIVSLPGLRFIGEAERYGEYIIAPLAIHAAHGYYTEAIEGFVPDQLTELVPLDPSLLALGFVVVVSGVLLAGNVFILSRRFSTDRGPDERELLDFLHGIEGTRRIMTIPAFYGYHFLPQTDHKYVFYRPSCLATPQCRSTYFSLNYSHNYPYEGLQALVKAYNLDYLIVLSDNRSQPFEYDDLDSFPMSSLSGFDVYDVTGD